MAFFRSLLVPARAKGPGVKARELFWGTPRVGAPKEGKKAADAGRGQIYDTVIVIITALRGCQAFFLNFFLLLWKPFDPEGAPSRSIIFSAEREGA